MANMISAEGNRDTLLGSGQPSTPCTHEGSAAASLEHNQTYWDWIFWLEKSVGCPREEVSMYDCFAAAKTGLECNLRPTFGELCTVSRTIKSRRAWHDSQGIAQGWETYAVLVWAQWESGRWLAKPDRRQGPSSPKNAGDVLA